MGTVVVPVFTTLRCGRTWLSLTAAPGIRDCTFRPVVWASAKGAPSATPTNAAAIDERMCFQSMTSPPIPEPMAPAGGPRLEGPPATPAARGGEDAAFAPTSTTA